MHSAAVADAQLSASGWVNAQLLLTILRNVQATNVTRLTVWQRVFQSGVFEVDDLVFGMYQAPCKGGSRREAVAQCGCNEGCRTSELIGYDTALRSKLYSQPGLRGSLPMH